MTDLVPADSIEQIVGRRRHRADHIARRKREILDTHKGVRQVQDLRKAWSS